MAPNAKRRPAGTGTAPKSTPPPRTLPCHPDRGPSAAPPHGLIVDGPRPAVEWVAGIPAAWTPSASHRLVLAVLALACDAYEDTSAPGVDNLARWGGLSRGQTFAILRSLAEPDGTRPALIERVGTGSPARYRLRTETGRGPADG